MVRFVFALALVMLTSLACGVGEATPTPQSLEMRSRPAVTPAPRQVSTPTAFQVRALSVDEYSKVCGELMDSEPFLITSTDPKAYRAWLDSWLTLKAPTELSEFHTARTAFLQYLVTADGEARGPSAQFQHAYDAMLESMVSLPVSLREPLSATGCVSSVEDFSSIARDLDTKARLDERETSKGPLSIDEYAEWCADIVRMIPMFDDRAAIGRYLRTEWGKLTPPLDISGFHEALLEWYDEFERTGTLDAETPIGQRVAAELRQMDYGHFERLYYRTGCVGQRFVFTAGRAEDSHPPEPPDHTPTPQRTRRPFDPTKAPTLETRPVDPEPQSTNPAPAGPTTTPIPTTRSPDNEHEVIIEGVGITLGRAVLWPDERVTLFYAGRDISGDLDEAVVIDSAEITSSDGKSWPSDGHGMAFNRPPLALGWLTFPVRGAALGEFEVIVHSVQVGDGRLTGSWPLPPLPGLGARSDLVQPVVIESGICVSDGPIAIGFHIKACAIEHVDPDTVRQRPLTPVAPRLTPPPGLRPTPTSTPLGRPTPTRPPAKPLEMTDTLVFILCTPWHFHVYVKIDKVGTVKLGSRAPTTAARCVLP